MKKIAVVDDNDDLLFTIKYGVTNSDKSFDIITFNNPNDFIRESKKTKYDLILLDIMMPQLNGWDTFAEIKDKKNPNSKTPTIFLTAKTDNQSKRLGSIAADDYITKPFEVTELVKQIKAHLK